MCSEGHIKILYIPLALLKHVNKVLFIIQRVNLFRLIETMVIVASFAALKVKVILKIEENYKMFEKIILWV